jgi:galactokinase
LDTQLFHQHFPGSGKPIWVNAPGRVNLIGEHTDYNEGFVMPGAIDKGIRFAISHQIGNRISLFAHDLQRGYECQLEAVQPVSGDDSWANYVLGVVAQLQQNGYGLGGFKLLMGGDIPVGAGLSSSAAMECGTGFALSELFDLGIERLPLVKMAQQAEHTYAGVMCGIMDQFASTFGQADSVLQLDCRSLDFAYFPLATKDMQIVLCNTLVSHSLASSEYNVRRQECEAGVEILQKSHPEIKSLRDASLAQIENHRSQMQGRVYDRCRYVVEENLRVEQASKALKAGELDTFGQLMYGSHEGLQHRYEVSCPELDFLVDQTREDEAVLGARMMGGGFGGCTINLVRTDAVPAFTQRMKAGFAKQYGRELPVYVAGLSEGVNRI